LNASIRVRLTNLGGGTIFEGLGRHAGLEVFSPEHLLAIVAPSRR
jgi:hypothetical protein